MTVSAPFAIAALPAVLVLAFAETISALSTRLALPEAELDPDAAW